MLYKYLGNSLNQEQKKRKKKEEILFSYFKFPSPQYTDIKTHIPSYKDTSYSINLLNNA